MRPDVVADLEKLFGRARRDAALGLARYGEHEAARALPTTCPLYVAGRWSLRP
jgi:hypothetical protein